MRYSPVTKSDLAKGYPTPGWNSPPPAAAAAAVRGGDGEPSVRSTPAAAAEAIAAAARSSGKGTFAAALRAHSAVAAAVAANQGQAAGAAAAAASRRQRQQGPEKTVPSAGFERVTGKRDEDGGWEEVPSVSSGDEGGTQQQQQQQRGSRGGSRRSSQQQQQQQQEVSVRSSGPAGCRPSLRATATRHDAAGAASNALASQAGGAVGPSGSTAALQQLLGRSSPAVKWRAILPDGDRVGPFSSAELLEWLAGGGRAPKGVGGDQARRVAADGGPLQLAGIVATDYSSQKLPGERGFGGGGHVVLKGGGASMVPHHLQPRDAPYGREVHPWCRP